ncbi:MAG: hypothetical protein ACK5BJ_12620 [Bacteroidota bacterium]|jgi:hypothetical protein|nr:hypothetical protein [Cytophagales bacterium]MCE2958091.1 hypothetical protein [Flammeovirgaceae bacterium]MCZ8070762.1 hypothetical protein [Cytophagales bacterium]
MKTSFRFFILPLAFQFSITCVTAQNWTGSSTPTNTTDAGTFSQLTSTPWGGQHGLLFNAYKSPTLVNGPLSTLGNTKHSNDASFGSGAGAIMFLANGGNMEFFISNASPGPNQNVTWGLPKMLITRNGNVAIGTNNFGGLYKFYVAGKIAAYDEIKVFTNGSSFPDYVFAPDYKLRSLEETEKYIKENSHLPEVPSAADIAKEGMSLNGMSEILLKKVEELTLHLIEMKKENEELKKRLENLEKKGK